MRGRRRSDTGDDFFAFLVATERQIGPTNRSKQHVRVMPVRCGFDRKGAEHAVRGDHHHAVPIAHHQIGWPSDIRAKLGQDRHGNFLKHQLQITLLAKKETVAADPIALVINGPENDAPAFQSRKNPQQGRLGQIGCLVDLVQAAGPVLDHALNNRKATFQ